MAICLSFVTLSCEDSFEDLDGEFHATESKHSSLPLKLKSTIWAIDGSGGNYRCTIEADKNVHWQITGLPSWLKFSRTSGIGSTVLTYSVERNPSASTVQTANLTLESTSKDKPSSTTYQVCQYIQSKDRIHRYGLEPGTITNYYYVLSQDTIDETIDTRLTEKERRMTEIMESIGLTR